MRGLVYREFYLRRKSYISCIVCVVMVMVLGLMIRGSLVYGNLALLRLSDEDGFEAVNQLSYYLFTYLPAVLIFGMIGGDHGVIVSDAKSRFDMFAYTLPVKETMQVAVKYALMIAVMLLGFALSMLNAALFAVIQHKDISENVICNLLLIVFIAAIIVSFQIPMLYHFRSGAVVRVSTIIVVAVVVMGFLSRLVADMTGITMENQNLSADEQVDKVMDYVFTTLPQMRDQAVSRLCVVTAAAVIIGFALSVKQLKRREK